LKLIIEDDNGNTHIIGEISLEDFADKRRYEGNDANLDKRLLFGRLDMKLDELVQQKRGKRTTTNVFEQ